MRCGIFFGGAGNGLLPFSPRCILSVTAGQAGLAGLYKFRANSIYDPDQTGGGHQPYGRDTLATLYNHYVVDSAVITISPIGACTGKVYGVTVADDSASSLDYSVLLEQKGNTSAIGTAGGTGNQAQCMARYNRFTQWPVFVDTSAPIGASPDEEIYFTCWMADITDQVNDQVKFQVSIEYNVTFYEPKSRKKSQEGATWAWYFQGNRRSPREFYSATAGPFRAGDHALSPAGSRLLVETPSQRDPAPPRKSVVLLYLRFLLQ